MSQQTTGAPVTGREIKSAMLVRRFAMEQIVKVFAVNACLLVGYECRTFEGYQCVAVNQKSKPQSSRE